MQGYINQTITIRWPVFKLICYFTCMYVWIIHKLQQDPSKNEGAMSAMLWKALLILASGQWDITYQKQNFGSNRTSMSLWSFVVNLRRITFISDFMISYMYVSPSPRADNPLGTKFWRKQKAFVIPIISCNSQKDHFHFWFWRELLMISHMYTAFGLGQSAPGEQNFDVNRHFLSLLYQVSSFKQFESEMKVLCWSQDHILPFFNNEGQVTDTVIWDFIIVLVFWMDPEDQTKHEGVTLVTNIFPQ